MYDWYVLLRQPSLDHAIQHFAVAQFDSATTGGDVVGDLAHVFHTTGDHDLGVAQFDGIRREHDGFHPGSTNLIDRRTRNRIRNPGKHRCLASRSLAQVRRKDIAHIDFVDVVCGDARFFQHTFDRSSTQFGC